MNEVSLRRRAMFIQATKPSFDFIINTTRGQSPTDSLYVLPFVTTSTSRNYDMIIDWGDGSFEDIPANYSLANTKSHTYTVPGIYTIKIISASGKMPLTQFQFGESFNQRKLYRVLTPFLKFSNNGVTMETNCTYLFNTSSIQEYPDTLFDNNLQITSLSHAFFNCQSVGALSVGKYILKKRLLERLVNLTDLNNAFRFNYNILGYEDFFLPHSNLVNCSGIFNNCLRIQLTPNLFCDDSDPVAREERFKNLNVNMSNTFYNKGALTRETGTAPQLWNYNFGDIKKISCFAGSKNNDTTLTNYNEIPTEWK